MRKVPISLAIIVLSFVLAFSRGTFLGVLASLLWNALCLPLNIALTWILVKTGLYMWSRELAVQAGVLKDRERKKTGMMKANAMREKASLRQIKIYTARDDEETPFIRGTPRLEAYQYDDVEMG